MTKRAASWSVPLLVAAAVGGAAVLPGTASASDHPKLPARTAAELLAAVQTSHVTALSGTIVQTARLGLPDLPGADDAAALSPQTLVTGTHTARVWLDGAERQRLALLGQLSESDLVHNGSDLWTYSSNTGVVGHTVLPADHADSTPEKAVEKVTPQGAAAQALKAIDPSTQVTVDRTARVAGRAAYTLVLVPRDARSTVRKVLIAIDATRDVPLRVQVFGQAAKPAFETAFTSISYATPASSVFRFVVPKGAKVTSDLFGTSTPRTDANGTEEGAVVEKAPAPVKGEQAQLRTLGSGWTTVLALPAAADGSSALAGLTGGGSSAVLSRLLTRQTDGSQVLHTALLNALVLPDGRVFVGAVSTSVLQQAAAGTLG